MLSVTLIHRIGTFGLGSVQIIGLGYFTQSHTFRHSEAPPKSNFAQTQRKAVLTALPTLNRWECCAKARTAGSGKLRRGRAQFGERPERAGRDGAVGQRNADNC